MKKLGERNERIEPFLKDFGVEWDNLGYTKTHHQDGAEICSVEEIEELTVLYFRYRSMKLKVGNDIYFAPSNVIRLMAACYHSKVK